MAHPSPSPSGSSRHRRLSEVLAEQQEPFSLDLYLLEKSCSPAFVDDAACGDGACSTCWPTTKSTGRQAVRNRKVSRRSGVLRMLLSKILSSTPAPAVTKTRQRRAATDWRRVAEKQRTPDRFELTLRSASPRAIEEHMEDNGDESSKKQLSPVSVLEQRLFEHSSPPPHEPKALAIFGELLESAGAYTPNTLLDDVLAIAKDPSSAKSKDGHRRSSTDSSTSPRPRVRRKKKKHAHRKEDVAFEKDFARLTTSLVASEMAGARVCAEDLRPTVENVGAAIAAAVLEALTEETAAELI